MGRRLNETKQLTLCVSDLCMTLLHKMGIILCANTTLSLIFAMGFLAALLDLAGPTSTPVVVGRLLVASAPTGGRAGE